MIVELPSIREMLGGYTVKSLKYFVFVIMFVFLVGSSSAVAQTKYSLNVENIGSGVFTINYSITSSEKVKLMVQKDGTTLFYNLSADRSVERFPLQLGDGNYRISVLENVSGNRYRVVFRETVMVQQNSSLDVYLRSIQMVGWAEDSEAVLNARELTMDVNSDEEKVQIIYDYLVRNYRYDDKIISSLSYDYLPNIDDMFLSQKGICYDFSSMFAAMLRSVGVPTKLVMGYADDVEGYHAWNEVYLQGAWVIIDTSYDALMYDHNQPYSMYKNTNFYSKVYEF